MATKTMQNGDVTKRLEGKVAIITGGDRGIGRAIALRLAAEGDIALCYRTNHTGAEEVVRLVTDDGAAGGTGRRALALQADVSDITQVRTFIKNVFDRFGAADILVNNAGLERRADFWEVTEQDYDLVMSVNLKGVFFITQAVVRQWITAKQAGKIINISWSDEELPFPHFAAYCASKGGLKMFYPQPCRRTRAFRHYRQQHRAGCDRNAHQ